MSFYRIYSYPLAESRKFKHIYFKRDRVILAKRNTAKILEKIEHETKLDNSLVRSRRIIRDLILCNQFDYFCTFTFSGEKIDRYDYQACKKRLTRLFNNYQQRYSCDFRYLVVPEQHKDGAWHFHGVLSGIRDGDFVVPDTIWKHPNKQSEELIQVPNTKGYVDWAYYSKKLGFFSCSRIRHYEACANYVTKYITKSLETIQKGQRVFMASANLKRPELVFDCDAVPCEFEPDYKDDFVQMAWAGESFTVGKFIPDWAGECCSELNDDDFYESDIEKVIFEPLVGEQLKIG
ncbi:hypothetical protein EDD70_3012 [Hydrogenoanaerobacterium saccharovorans]|uniref:Replication-associated protein ORF2/G2P domain-containing protein n=2 Tax=Hydrogenoanaerobacterium saccharovorans TaxID=474960 RepID=A0A1H8EJL6_9FIRM|nr:hypothetical protein [Hydrogenoanaerobacterium saccharovorans]RPF41886.1 hypothetical protein EDD70_3012 [Hydrogenoanaerobacterium saccharovorans]SEN19057.1 hypothetical protein SAMN05216180_3024 [Hydrogenoanaerobacterium saccharovorans]